MASPLQKPRFDSLPERLVRQLRIGRALIAEPGSRASAAPPDERFPTAVPELDRLLGGGLRRRQLVEISGRRTSGRFSLALSVLAAATRMGEAVALVDLGDHFDPQAAAAAGVVLERLLWARPRHLKPALAGAEILLSGGFPLVVLDLGVPPVPGGRGYEASWLRLARSAAGHDAALLVLSPYRSSGTAARAVFELRRAEGRWLGETTRLLHGLRARIVLEKVRGGQGQAWGEGATLELRYCPASLAEPLPLPGPREIERASAPRALVAPARAAAG